MPGDPVTAVQSQRPRPIVALARALRPAQWVKNGVLLVPAVFSLKASDPAELQLALAAVLVFCGLSSAAYLWNDVADRDRDRSHPVKRHRPVAAGDLTPAAAIGAALVLAIGALAVATWIGRSFVLVAASYLMLQVVYSIGLKHLVLVDVFAIAAGFVLRVVAGAEAVDVPVSNWLYLTTSFLALFLALQKRRAERLTLEDEAARHRSSLVAYSPALLDQLSGIMAGATVMTYSLYTLAPDTIARFGTDRLKFTIPFVLFGVSRYLLLVHNEGAGGEPERVLVGDRGMQLTVLGYVIAVGSALYRQAP